ncbi:MAG: serine/threonine-protein kinase, partial [bacterium]|nr:serine/threonine-protein kinase [bacterium]
KLSSSGGNSTVERLALQYDLFGFAETVSDMFALRDVNNSGWEGQLPASVRQQIDQLRQTITSLQNDLKSYGDNRIYRGELPDFGELGRRFRDAIDALDAPAIVSLAVPRGSGTPTPPSVVEALRTQLNTEEGRSRATQDIQGHLEALRAGRDLGTNATADALRALQSNDPETFRLLLQSDAQTIGRLVEQGTLFAMIAGQKRVVTDSTGERVSVFVGNAINAGGVGRISRIAYFTESSQAIETDAVFKEALDNSEETRQYFSEEIEGAKRMLDIDHPMFLDIFHIIEGDHPFIILETGAEFKNLQEAVRIDEITGEPLLFPNQFLRIISQMPNALVEFHRRGLFHGDLKEMNVAVMINRSGEWVAKIIDNAPVEASRVHNQNSFANSPGYSIPNRQLMRAQREFRQAGLSDAEIDRRLASAFDNYSIGMMIDYQVRRSIILRESLFVQKLLEDIKDPVKSTEPGFWENSALPRLQRVIEYYEGGELPQAPETSLAPFYFGVLNYRAFRSALLAERHQALQLV